MIRRQPQCVWYLKWLLWITDHHNGVKSRLAKTQEFQRNGFQWSTITTTTTTTKTTTTTTTTHEKHTDGGDDFENAVIATITTAVFTVSLLLMENIFRGKVMWIRKRHHCVLLFGVCVCRILCVCLCDD